MNTFKLRWWVVALGVTAFVLLAVAACSDSSSHLGLRGAAGGSAMDPEAERLRRMMAVRLIDQTDPSHPTTEKSAPEVQDLVKIQCGFYGCSADTDACLSSLCESQAYLCTAKTLLAMAMPQSVAPTIEEPHQTGTITHKYTVPPQSAATNAALAASASVEANLAALIASQTLQDMLGTPLAGANGCTTADAASAYGLSPISQDNLDYQKTPRALVASTVLAEAFHTEREISEVATASTLDAADAQLSSSRSSEQAQGRAVAGGSRGSCC